MSLETPRKSEEVPHSNKFGPAPEVPVRDFDNTSLQEAVDNRLIQTPDHAGTLSEKSEKKKISLRTKIIASIAGIGLVAGGVGVAASLANRETPTEPGTSEPGEQPIDQGEGVLPPEGGENEAPVPSSPEVNEGFDVSQPHESVVYENLFETLTPEQQAEITRYEEMSLEDFRTLPHQEQLVFAQYVRDNNIAVLEYRLEQSGDAAIITKSNFDTPEGVFANHQVNSFLLSSLKEFSDEDGIVFDYETAKKASALLVDHSKDPLASQGIDALIDTWNINTPAGVNPNTYNSGTSNEDGYFLANSTTFEGETVQSTFIVTEGSKVDGTPFKQTERILSVDPSDPRYKQDLANG